MISIFFIISLLAVICGGILSAFSARKPTRRTAWLSAYLVLIVGMVQLGLAASLQRLGLSESTATVVGFVAYNLGNIGVMAGTMLRGKMKASPVLVNTGGLLLAVAMVVLVQEVRQSPLSVLSVGLFILVALILVSMPIGLILSYRRRAHIKQGPGYEY